MPRSEPSIGAPVKNHAHVFELDDVTGRFPAHRFDGVLIGQIIAAFNGVERVRLPGVALSNRGVDPACAALEWLRMGCTFVTIATSAPARAASRAARMPAKPAPRTTTS